MMKNRWEILFIVTLLTYNSLYAQTKGIKVNLAPFSSVINDEFSPVYYQNGIVFCSNLKKSSLISYKNDQKKPFSILFIPKKDSSNWGRSDLLAKELTTSFNDGPVTFNEKGNIIYYCRNNNIRKQLKDVTDNSNKMGIYAAELIDGKWTNIKPFSYNNQLYSMVTPALAPDGKRLYFASDMPGGYGGADLYYCDWKDTVWAKPVNLGPAINTIKNESYPFICKSGKLFFASDGHKGFGGKDIYFSREIALKWSKPIHLDSGINSTYDDFGLVTDENFKNGFFSSNRGNSDDIYSFSNDVAKFPVCDSMKKNNYCFLFYDDFQDKNDSVTVKYEWDFGNGIKKYGLQVRHCFPGAGKYEVKLKLIDILKGDSVLNTTSYNFELIDSNQVFINSPDFGIVNKAISFDGLKTNLPGFKISDYVWNFGEGFTISGPIANRFFNKKGEYTVQLGLLGEKDSLGNNPRVCVYKKLKIFDDYQELATQTTKEICKTDENNTIGDQNKVGMDSVIPINTTNEIDPTQESFTLKVKNYLLDGLSELQKHKITETLNETSGCEIKINNTGIIQSSFPNLIKFVKLLKEDPGIKLEIAVHTGDNGSSGNNLEISDRWAQDFCSYFLNNGIKIENLHCKGYGGSRPIVGDRKNGQGNKRVEFIFINYQN